MPLIADPLPGLSTRTWGVLRALKLTTRAQVITAYEDGSLARAGLGRKSLSELRCALGWDPPLPTPTVPNQCPKCGGDSGFRVKVVRAEVRHYTWQEVLESVPCIQVKSDTRIECRDCDWRLPIRFRVPEGSQVRAEGNSSRKGGTE